MVKPLRTVLIVPSLPPALERLRDLAYNLRWAWDHETVALFRRLDRDLWEQTGHNPVRLLGSIQQERLDAAAANPGFRSQLAHTAERLDDYVSDHTSTWYARNHGDNHQLLVAYFSAEFGLTECLPIYSGGLGVLAGDHLKSASDLGLPLAGIGLAYQKGYSRQYLNADGWQNELRPINDFFTMPMQLERDAEDQPLIVEVPFPGRTVKAQIWCVRVGRVPLYLLDTNIPLNGAEDQDITDELYGGDNEMRIKQEMVLGIGGVRALSALGVQPTVYHMNEGHAAFSALERIRIMMERDKVPFNTARRAAMIGGIFTTHTPVPAGIDVFGADLIDRYLGPYYEWLGITREEFLALGRVDANNWQEPFNMAILATRLSIQRNGVSELHARVSRAMWKNIWPRMPEEEIPIGAVVNGVHTPSWLSADMATLYDRYMGPGWREDQADRSSWQEMAQAPAEELWRAHEGRRERLVNVARQRLQEQFTRRGAPQSEIDVMAEALNPDALTIGFARRFATYKRATLLLQDPERLARILSDKDRPVQIIFAGKSHPADNPGKELIREVVHFAREEPFRRRVVFLEDYDMALARQMVSGVDVWLNTPRRPREASGTSGMKAAVNGVLNLSTLDGWWAEAYNKDIGWAIGKGEVYVDQGYQDQVESEALYDLLEKEIIPLFYERGPEGLPRAWIDRMRSSIVQLAPVYNTNRMVRQYTEQYYVTADERFRVLSADGMARAGAQARWLERMNKLWGQIWVRDVRASQDMSEVRVGDKIEVTGELFLGDIDPADVSVQLYFGRMDGTGNLVDPEVLSMEHVEARAGGIHLFVGGITARTSGRFGYTVRVMPNGPDMLSNTVPGLISWA